MEEEKEAKKAKSSKDADAPDAPDASTQDDEEDNRVNTIKIEGKKYLVSPKTGIVYDYYEWKNKEEQVVLGKYNKETQQIEFKNADESSSDDDSAEEEEETYDE